MSEKPLLSNYSAFPQLSSPSNFDADLTSWLALNRLRGIGPVRAAELMSRFGSPKALFALNRSELKGSHLSDALISKILQPDLRGVEQDLRWLEARDDHHILTPDDSRYPDFLRELSDAPIVLFVNGEVDQLAMPQLAVVGSRTPSPVGAIIAREFASELAATGVVITSGLALGIDAAAHQGALGNNGKTLAVLGTGPDKIYPARHLSLAEQIKSQGAIVTEFVPGMGPRKEHFPRRNRLISGMSLGTLVVEATERSGSLITARLAAEQGREVFAIPGSIRNPQSQGCHRLIKDGAKLVESVQDIFDELKAMTEVMRSRYLSSNQGQNDTSACEQKYDENRPFLERMGYDPVSIDELVRRSGLTASDVSSMLLTLELQGLVSSQHGGLYQRLT